MSSSPPRSTPPPAPPRSTPPIIYILLSNPKPSNNLGPILRCGAAYNASFIFIGYAKCAVEGSHGASKHVHIQSFPTYPQAVQWLKNEGDVKTIYGILGDASFHSNPNNDDDNDNIIRGIREINSLVRPVKSYNEGSCTYPPSYPVLTRPFSAGNICFSISKRSPGLPCDQARYCDSFLHIPTSTPFLTDASDNKNSGDSDSEGNDMDMGMCGMMDSQTNLSIVLHHYTAWAGYTERDFMGQKFHVRVESVEEKEERGKKIREERERLEKMRMEEGEDKDIMEMTLFAKDEEGDY